ncbi:hypothetical protein RA19_09605 [Leisingera sp. ANG-M1]|uniref:LamB/YcsF family protein n=1 Tax=Leisingera sp. ANG-M1 TaxID=1577895 RepID=UPI00057D27F7|nr:5-oxoprolinase subunit PxpA [Leisingera sp. ANG-M1]KIC10972.1 hypothetical protein RA19_09605 [Leisingera sp. ANG-M1]
MIKTVDLNADMGESFGAWQMGNDFALLESVTSVNIACGFHAGDPDVMARTIAAAHDRGVGIGAHPGFPDLQGFGRRQMSIPLESLGNMVRYQLGAAQAMARACGAEVQHLKLHGALANQAAKERNVATACYEAALSVAPDIIVVAMAATEQQAAAEELGCKSACEVFADRAYNPDGSLVSRSEPGAVIHDAGEISQCVVRMLKAGAIITTDGTRIATRIDTICLHGDTASAEVSAQRIREALRSEGIDAAPFSGGA